MNSLSFSKLSFLKRVGKAKILRNIQGGLDEMLIIAYIVGGWVQKGPKKCLRNIWTVPRLIRMPRPQSSGFKKLTIRPFK